MDINEIICAVDQRLKKDEYVLIRVEEWQTLKTAVSKQTAHNSAMLPCDNKECPAWDCGICSSYLGAKCVERQQ